jgi:hypothetical protein
MRDRRQKLKAPGDARPITNNTGLQSPGTSRSMPTRPAFPSTVSMSPATRTSAAPTPGHAAFSNQFQPCNLGHHHQLSTRTVLLPIGAAPDFAHSNISNPRGLVQVHSAAGSILSQGNIYAGTVDIKAANGDFVQSYVDNFFHIGGDPKAIYEGTTTPGGVIANGNVFISSRYININGIIQSGIASYTLTPPSGGAADRLASMLGLTAGNNQTAMDAYRVAHPTGVTTFTNDRGQSVTYNAAKNRLEVSEAFAIADAASAQGKSRNPTGEYALVSDYGNVGARYDTANNRYLINGTEVKGGYIQLLESSIRPARRQATPAAAALDGC